MNKLKENVGGLINGEQMTASGESLRGGGIEQKGNRTHGHRQQCGDCRGGGEYKGTKW